jgi:hypothetical protein
MREPEGEFSSLGLAKMFDPMAGNSMKSGGYQKKIEAKFKLISLVAFWAQSILLL